MRRLPTSATLLALSLLAATAQAQVSLTGGPYAQDFNALANTGTSSTLPTGWLISEAGTAANALYTAGTGSSNAGDSYSFGTGTDVDRALGGVQSGSLTSTIGACFTNSTGATLDTLQVAYTGEQWRLGATGRAVPDRLDFEYSLNATSLTTGVWTAVDPLDFAAPVTTGTTGALNGNSAANRAAISGNIVGLSIANGAGFCIRWNDFNASGADDGLAIDDFSLTVPAGTPALSINDVSVTEGDSGTTTASFTVSLSAPAPAGGVSFDVASSDGTATTAGGDYVALALTGQSIAAGASSATVSVTVNGDTAVEPNETFALTISNVVGATLADGSAVGTIGNDDAAASPDLSIADVSVLEGNAGTTVASFTVQLATPAPAGGVSFDIATADGSASAGSDYVARALTAQTIAAGASSATFDVTLNGDSTLEPDETYTVSVTNVSGATVVDGSATGTIRNDDVALTAIHAVQGAGSSSPIVGSDVSVEGIVTARRGNGFFIQTADADADADPTTSQGLFVFTSTTPPAAATVGHRVRVFGRVTEFAFSDTTQRTLPLTQLAGNAGAGVVLTVTQISTGQPLPTPTDLAASDLAPGNPREALERFEGMRVRTPALVTVAPTNANISEPNATATDANGVFFATAAGVPRPLREPGLDPDEIVGQDSAPSIPRFDNNTEMLRIDSDGQIGAARVRVDAGVSIPALVGVIDYAFAAYSLLPDAGQLANDVATGVLGGGRTPTAVADAASDEITVGGFNLLRFFDDVNDPAVTSDPVLTAAALDKRLGHTAEAICRYVRLPDILGVVEVENLAVLTQLANRINTLGAAGSSGCARNPQYVAYLQEGNDVGGIDVGFLVSTRTLADSRARVEVIEVVQLGKDTAFNNPDGSTDLLNDRPPLLLRARINHSGAGSDAISVYINHMRSLGGVSDTAAGPNGWPSAGARVRAKRGAQAQYLAQLVHDRQTANPNERIALLGDFNVFEFNDGLVDGMGIITGRPAPANQVLLPLSSPISAPLTVMTPLSPRDEQYSFTFDGNAQSLDHAVANQRLLDDMLAVRTEHARINADFAEARFGLGPLRTSDHDPVVLYLRSAQASIANAQVGAPAAGAPVTVGTTQNLVFTLSNAGPAALAGGRLVITVDRALSGLAASVSSGSCAAASVTGSTTTLACTGIALAAGGSGTATVTFTVPAAARGQRLNVGASLDSRFFDPDTGNNAGAVAVDVAGNAAPVFTGTPSISGTPLLGATLSASNTGTSDADGDAVTLGYQWLRNGVAISGATAASYVVSAADIGAAITLEVAASDGTATTRVTTAAVTVGNRAPVAGNDGYSAIAGRELVVAAPGLLANDGDADGDAIAVDAATVARGRFSTANGRVEIGTDGGFRYTANAGFSGTDTFRYGIVDARGAAASVEGVVSIEVTLPLPTLFARDDRFVLAENSPALLLDVLRNDLAEASRLAGGRLAIVQAPLRGTLSVDDAGTPGTAADDRLRYAAPVDVSGDDAFAYRLCEGGGSPRCAEALVQVVVRPLVDAQLDLEIVGNGGFRDVAVPGFRAMTEARYATTAPRAPVASATALAVDPSPESPWVDGGRQTTLHALPTDAAEAEWRILLDARSLSGGDVDLYAGVDANGDGVPQPTELQCTSAMSTVAERCELAIVVPASAQRRYWVIAHNAGAGAHTVRIERSEVRLPAAPATGPTTGAPRLTATGPSQAAARSGWPLRLGWALPTLLDGQSMTAYVGLAASATGALNWMPVRLTRRGGDAAPQPLLTGGSATIAVPASGRVERLFIDVPAGAAGLTIRSSSASPFTLRLVPTPAPVASAAPGVIAPADPQAEALEFDLEAGSRRVSVSRPRAGRWYVVPVNAGDQPIELTLSVEITGSAPVVRPGGYFNVARSGHGLFLYPAGDQWAGLWYTYLQDGSPTWYYLQGNAPGANGLWQGTLYRSRWNGRSNTLTAIGEGVVAPTAADAFTFTYRLDGETGSEAYSSFGRGCPTVGGRRLDASSHWFNPATSGTGYSVQLFPNYEFYAVFGYDAAGVARFLVAERPAVGGDTIDVPLEQLRGTCPLCARSGSPQRTTIGTLRRHFVDGQLSRFVVDGTYVDGVPGRWTADDAVQPLGGPGSTQGCAVP